MLRAKGKTYTEINDFLGIKIPKATMANWCQNIPLPDSYWKRLDRINKYNYLKARKAAWLANKLKRERFLNELLKNNEILQKKVKDIYVLKMILAMLYLGEGTKWKTHRGLVLGSSDPNIILLYIKLLEMCYGLKRENMKCRISFRADQNIKSLERYWSKIIRIPLKNFYKTIPDPRTIGKPTKKKDYKGVCVIMCPGTHIQLELETIPGLILKGL